VQFAATQLLSAQGFDNRGTISHLASLSLIGAMLLAAFGIAALTYLTVERIARWRLRRLFGLAKPKLAAG
jgi:peptidoglycan/LPS O-acetylase OafA/YrhL